MHKSESLYINYYVVIIYCVENQQINLSYYIHLYQRILFA